MRTHGSDNLARSPGTDAEQQEYRFESCVQLSFSAVPSELLTQLGVEHFVVSTCAESLNVGPLPGGARESASAALTSNGANTTEPWERDFWGEVAALSNGGIVLPPNGLSAKPDVVAYAIATVCAKYAFATETKPSAVPGAPGTTALAPRTAAPQQTSSTSSTVAVGDPKSLEECDLAAVLESLLDLEQAAVVKELRSLDSTTFEQARSRAALAVVAGNVIQNSALKAAEGRRG